MTGVWMFQLKPAVNTVIARSMLVLLTAPWSVIFSSPKAAVESNALDRMSGFPDRPNVSKAACLDIVNPGRKKRLYRTADEGIRLVHTRVASDPNPHFDVAQCDIGVQIDNMGVHAGRGFGIR